MAFNDQVFEFDEYRVDGGTRQLLRDEEPVALAPKTFEVLLLLLTHNGQVLEKNDLMKRIWPDTFVEEANLNVHISAIRKAIGESAQNPRYITTIPGRGYRFNANVRVPAAVVPQAVSEPAARSWLGPWRLAAACTVAAVVLSGLASAQYFRRPSDVRLQSPAERAKPSLGRRTHNPDAHRFYLAGRHFWNKRTAHGLRRAIENYQKAIDEDPQFALPYAGLADAYSMLGDFTGKPGDYRAQAMAAAKKALERDDSLAETHASLAYLQMRSWQWDGVENGFRRAIEINPSYATAHHWYSIFLELTGRSEEAVAEATRAQELDPLSPIINESLGSRLFFARKFDRAEEQLRKAIEIEPSFQAAHESLALIYIHKGLFEEALRELARPGQPDDRPNSEVAGYAYALSGRQDEARAILTRLEGADPIGAARIHVALGERDQALDCLERAAGQHIDHLVFIRVDPSWDAIRSEPRFQEVVRSVFSRTP